VTFPVTEPHESGSLAVGDGNLVYWDVRGNPYGKPVVLLHGGPGGGCKPGMAQVFDPALYRIVMLDQRGCGRSTPHASDPATDLSTNTTEHLIADIVLLRGHLGVARWMVVGWSWGTTLGLAYAEAHPDRVTEVVLASVTTTGPREVDWITRSVGRLFPEEWARFRAAVPAALRDRSMVDAYAALLADPDPAVRDEAARAWCEWEDSHVGIGSKRRHFKQFDDPAFRLCFVRLTTHYWRHAAFLPEGQLLRDVTKLNGIPGVLITGRLDLSGPPDTAWELAQAWPDAELHLVDDDGHGGPGITAHMVAATNRFAANRL